MNMNMKDELKKPLALLFLFERVHEAAEHSGYDYSGVTKEDITSLGLLLLEQDKKIEVLKNHIRRGADKEGYDLDFLARFDEGTAWELNAAYTYRQLTTIVKLKSISLQRERIGPPRGDS